MKNELLGFDEKVRFVAISILVLIAFSRGAYWMYMGDNARSESKLYHQLSEVASLEMWGLLFVIGSLILLASNIFIFSASKKRWFYWFFIVGTGIIAISYLIVGMASVQNSVNWLTPAHNTIYFVGFTSLCILGVKELWKILKSKEV